MTVFIKFTTHVYFVPVILLSVLIYPTDIHVEIICTRMPTADSLQQKVKNKQYASTEDWLNKGSHVHTMDYFTDDTKSKGKIYTLISNYFQDTWSEKQQSTEFLVFYYSSG